MYDASEFAGHANNRMLPVRSCFSCVTRSQLSGQDTQYVKKQNEIHLQWKENKKGKFKVTSDRHGTQFPFRLRKEGIKLKGEEEFNLTERGRLSYRAVKG